MKPVLIYCYDAYCGWCYGFSPVISKIVQKYKSVLDSEVLSGGMILPAEPRHISFMAEYIEQAYKVVEERTGVHFGKDFLWHILHHNESDWYPNSEKPAIALSIFKEIFPDRQVEFASDLQYALHYEGRDLTDNEAYRIVLEKYGIESKSFFEKLNSAEFREKAHYDFALVKQLKVTGFPAVLIQMDDSRFYLVCRGYTDFNTLDRSISAILQSITTDSSSRS